MRNCHIWSLNSGVEVVEVGYGEVEEVMSESREIFDPTMNNLTSADDPFSLLMNRFESCVTQNTWRWLILENLMYIKNYRIVFCRTERNSHRISRRKQHNINEFLPQFQQRPLSFVALGWVDGRPFVTSSTSCCTVKYCKMCTLLSAPQWSVNSERCRCILFAVCG